MGTSRVTLLGDAAHGVLPTLGMGANLALNDAALLTEQLDRFGRGEVELLDAIGTYEAQMRETAYPILRMTLDHDKNFGGGGLAEAISRGETSSPRNRQTIGSTHRSALAKWGTVERERPSNICRDVGGH